MRRLLNNRKARKSKNLLFLALSALAVVAMMIGSAFAWTDFGQSKTNRFRGTVEADVTLHDEYDDKTGDKDVFVENSGKSPIYVRVRLDEYMEIDGTSFVDTAAVRQKDTWTPHTYNCDAIENCEQPATSNHLFHDYYTWEMSGAQRSFVEGTPGLVYSKLDANGKVDTNPTGGKPTADASSSIIMSKYLALKVLAESQPAIDDGIESVMSAKDFTIWTAATTSGCWILDDTDTAENGGAWAYWSVALGAGQATNLLLDSVTRTGKEPSADWYYGIDVKLQAVTVSDFGKWNDAGYKITSDAEILIASWM